MYKECMFPIFLQSHLLDPFALKEMRDHMQNTANPGTVQENLWTMWWTDSYNTSSYAGKDDVWFMVSCSARWPLSFFLTTAFVFQNQNNKKLETYGEMEPNQNDLLCSQFSATEENLLSHAFWFIRWMIHWISEFCV